MRKKKLVPPITILFLGLITLAWLGSVVSENPPERISSYGVLLIPVPLFGWGLGSLLQIISKERKKIART